MVSHVEGHRRKMLVHKSRLKVLPNDQGRDLVNSDSNGTITNNDELDVEETKNDRKVRESEKLRISNEQSAGKGKSAGYGDKKQNDLDGNIEKDGEQTANVRSDAKKIKKWEAAEQKTHKMKLRSRKQ